MPPSSSIIKCIKININIEKNASASACITTTSKKNNKQQGRRRRRPK
jgi:hypothetical protein